MLQPKKTKFRKAHKGRIHGNAKGGTELAFGQFGLKSQEPERVTARQIEAARRAITREMQRAGRVRVPVFPDLARCAGAARVPWAVTASGAAPAAALVVMGPGVPPDTMRARSAGLELGDSG